MIYRAWNNTDRWDYANDDRRQVCNKKRHYQNSDGRVSLEHANVQALGVDLETMTSKAFKVTFPREAENTMPMGPYETHYKKELEALQEINESQRQVHCTSRDFIARTSRDAVQLRCLIAAVVSPAQSVARTSRNRGSIEIIRSLQRGNATRLDTCFVIKPDIDHFGVERLTENKFQRVFKGDIRVFLKHMFEKHHGEIIYVNKHHKGITENPDNPAFYHHQYVTGNSANDRAARRNSYCFFKDKSACGDPSKVAEFCNHMSEVPSSVFFPMAPGQCAETEFHYFSLASLIWELADKNTLLEIYTFFCNAPLLAMAAPHSTKGSGSAARSQQRRAQW